MKNLIKSITFIILIIIILGACFTLCACGSDRIVVYTNAFFAPFEYYDGTDIVGVDVEIMNLVGKKTQQKGNDKKRRLRRHYRRSCFR